MDVSYDKFKIAIKLVFHNKLDECRDDTLIEKLITLVNEVFDADVFNKDQINELIVICREVLIDWKINLNTNKYLIGPLFSIYFKILGNSFVIAKLDEQILKNELKLLFSLIDNLIKLNDFSKQNYYFKGLENLFNQNANIKFIFEEEFLNRKFFNMLLDYCIDGKSFFVKKSIQQTLVSIFIYLVKNNFKEKSDLIQNFVSRLELKLNKDFIKILTQLFVDEQIKEEFLNFNINKYLIGNLNEKLDENLTLCLIDYLANNLNLESEILFVYAKLIKFRQIKSLTKFSSKIANKNVNYLNKWYVFVIYPFIIYIKYEKKYENLIQASLFEKSLVESKTDDKVIIYCLFYLRNYFPSNLDTNEIELVFQIIKIFFDKILNESRNKLIRETILLLGTIGEKIKNLTSNLLILIIDCLINLFWKSIDNFKCESLTWLRHLSEKYFHLFDVNVKTKLYIFLEDIFKLDFNEDNLNTIDSGFEILNLFNKLEEDFLLRLDANTLQTIMNFWKISNLNLDNLNFKISILPTLLKMNLVLDEINLSKLNFNKHDQIPKILFEYLKHEDSLARKTVVLAFNDNLNYLVNLANSVEKDKVFFLDLIYFLSESLVFDIDSEIQLNTINFLSKLFNTILNGKNLNEKLILKCILIFAHAIYFINSNSLVTFNVKQTCLIILDNIRKLLLKCMLIKSKFQDEFKECKHFVFEYEIVIKQCTYQQETNLLKKNKNEQLNEMFKDNKFCVNKIIENFTNERLNLKQDETEFKKKKIVNSIQTNTLIDFLFDFEIATFENRKIKPCILDDILAAKQNEDVILDCY